MNPFPDEMMLRQGAIFRMSHEFDGEGEKYRFFIVLNHSPQSDILIVLTSTTTQLAKLERRYQKEARFTFIQTNAPPSRSCASSIARRS